MVRNVINLQLNNCVIIRNDQYTEKLFIYYFQCGLVISSDFLKTCSNKLFDSCLETHKNHHIQNHSVTSTFALKIIERSRKRRVECGHLSLTGISNRSDIEPIPIASVKENDLTFSIFRTINNELICSCYPQSKKMELDGQVCNHIIDLIIGNQNNIFGKNKNKSARRLILND